MEINGTMLRAMSDELSALRKEAAIEKEAFPALGQMAQGLGKKLVVGASRLATKAGPGAGAGFAGGLQHGVKAFGGGAKGVGAMHKAVGKAAIGTAAVGAAGAVGAGALASRKYRRPKPNY